MIDGGLRPIFRQKLKVGFHWVSIETGGTGKGIPDSEFCCDGISGWCEFKQTDGWACTLLPEQVAWHVSRASRGGRSFIATRRLHDGGPRKGAAVDELWLHPGAEAIALRSVGLRGVPELGRWYGGPSRWDWSQVRQLLLADR